MMAKQKRFGHLGLFFLLPAFFFALSCLPFLANAQNVVGVHQRQHSGGDNDPQAAIPTASSFSASQSKPLPNSGYVDGGHHDAIDADQMAEVTRLLEAGEFTPETFPDAPLQLVRPDHQHKKLVIVEENLKLLQAISKPVSTVSVVGKFHSGKSFLMNQLMAKSGGFGIGSQVTPETMGIWVWGRVCFC